MSLLKTAQSTDNGFMRLTSYHRSRRDAAAASCGGHVDRAIALLDMTTNTSRSSQPHMSEITAQSSARYSADEELHSIIKNGTGFGTGGVSRDATEESMPSMSRASSSASSFSITRAFSSSNNYSPKGYGSPPRRQTPPPPRSPKSSDSAERRKIALNNPMSIPFMSVGRVEVQNAPLSPNSFPARQGPKRIQRPVLVTFGTLEKMDPQKQALVNTRPTTAKTEAYERASKLLKKVDASKQAAEKVEKAREAARQAIEKARKAKAAKEKAIGASVAELNKGVPKILRFADDDDQKPHSISEVRVPRKSSAFSDEAFDLLDDDDDGNSTVKDRYTVDDSRYDVVNAEDDEIDDVLDLEASKKRSESSIEKHNLPPLSPPRRDKQIDALGDLIDFSERMLGGKQRAMSKAAANDVDELDQCVDDAGSFADEFSCGSENEVLESSKPEAANVPEPMKRYPMPNAAILERILEDKGIQAAPPLPSPPPEVTDTVAYRVQRNMKSNDKALHDPTAIEDDASHGDELDDIMNFAAGLLGSKKSAPKDTKKAKSPSKQGKQQKQPKSSAPKETVIEKSPSTSKQGKQQGQPTFPTNLGQGDELDDIMDFAAGLLGGESVAKTPKVGNLQTPNFQESGLSIFEQVQGDQAIRKKESKSPKKAEDGGWFADPCSVWNEEFDLLESKPSAPKDAKEEKSPSKQLKQQEQPKSSAPKETDVEKSPSHSKHGEQQGQPTIPTNLGQGEELDDIMDFAAGLLAGKAESRTQKAGNYQTLNFQESGLPIFEQVHSDQAISKKESKTPKKVKDSGWFADACSVWNEEFFHTPEEEVVFDFTAKTYAEVVMQSAYADNENERLTLLKAAEESNRRSKLPLNTAPLPPPPEAFNLKTLSPPAYGSFSEPQSSPYPALNEVSSALADNLTDDKSSPSVKFPDLLEENEPAEKKMPEEIPSKGGGNEASEKDGRSSKDASSLPLTEIVKAEDEPKPGNDNQQPGQSHRKQGDEKTNVAQSSKSGDQKKTFDEGHKDEDAGEKQSKAGTILDSNDEYWDTLSTIASTKDLSAYGISHAHPHPEHPVHSEAQPALLGSLREGAPFGAILCGWLGMEQSNMATKRLKSGKATDTYGNTGVSTEGSIIPEIPKVIQYTKPAWAIEQNEQAQIKALNTVEILLTKRSSGSSSSSDSFYHQNGLNSFQADGSEQDIDKAIMRGQKMADTLSPKSSATLSRYGNDKGDEPLGSPSMLSHDSKSSRATPNSKKVTNRIHPWKVVGHMTSPTDKFQPINDDFNPHTAKEDSELAAMLGIKKMVSPDKEETEEVEDRSYGFISGSQDSDEINDLLMVLTRSAGDDDILENTPSQPDSADSGTIKNVLSSPASGEVEIILSSLKRAETMGHDEESVEFISSPTSSQQRGDGAEHVSSPRSPKRKGIKPEATRPLNTKDTKNQIANNSQIVQEETSYPMVDVLFEDDESMPKAGVRQLDTAQQLRVQSASASKKSTKQKRGNSQEVVLEGTSCPMIDVLFEDDEPLPYSGVQQLEKAQQQRVQNAAQSASKNSPKHNSNDSQEIIQKHISCPMIDVLLDDELLPNSGMQPLENKAQQKCVKGAAESDSKNSPNHKSSDSQEIVQKDTSCPMIDVLFEDDDPLPKTGAEQMEKAQQKRVQETAESVSKRSPKQSSAVSQEIVHKDTSCPMIDVLFEEDDPLPKRGVRQQEEAQQREHSSPSNPWESPMQRSAVSQEIVQKDTSCPMIDVLFEEDDSLLKSGVQQQDKAEQQREHSSPAKPWESSEQKSAVSQEIVHKDTSCPMIDVLFEEDDLLLKTGVRQLEKAQQQREHSSPSKPWKPQSDTTNTAATKELARHKTDGSHHGASCPIIDVLIKDDDTLLNAGVQQLEKAQRQREKDAAALAFRKETKKSTSSKPPRIHETTLLRKGPSCPMYDILINDSDILMDDSVSMSSTGQSIQKLVQPSQSVKEDQHRIAEEHELQEMQVVQSPMDAAVRLSPIKQLRVTQAAAQKADDISSVSTTRTPESKTKIMSVLLSKYDKIIEQLIHEKSGNKERATPDDTAHLEAALQWLREKRDYVLGLPGRQEQKQNSQVNTSPLRPRSPSKQRESKRSVRNRSPTEPTRDQELASRTIGKTSPTKSPSKSPSRSYSSPAGSSPTRSPRRQELPAREYTSPASLSTQQKLWSRDSASPTRSSRHQEYTSPTRSTARFKPKPLVSPSSKGSVGYSSPSRSSRRVDARDNFSSLQSSRRTAMSLTRLASHERSTIQSRDAATPTRSAGRQDRTSVARSPRRPLQSGKGVPRPEDKIEQLRRLRERSLSPTKGKTKDPYAIHESLSSSSDCSRRSRGGPEFREPREVKGIYSPERQRHSRRYEAPSEVQRRNSLFDDRDDLSELSEYGLRSREIQKELNLARMASEAIRNSHDELFDELGVFQDKLFRHSRRKDCEREFISESRRAMGEFQHRLERVRESARATARSGRETPDTLDQVEHALQEAWTDFDTVRGTMLNNLKLLTEAKEELMRERLKREEEYDHEQLRMLEDMIQGIRNSQHYKAEDILDSIRDSKTYGGRSDRSAFVKPDLPKYSRSERSGYSPRSRSSFSPGKREEHVPSDRQGYSCSNEPHYSHSASRYASYH